MEFFLTVALCVLVNILVDCVFRLIRVERVLRRRQARCDRGCASVVQVKNYNFDLGYDDEAYYELKKSA